MRRFIEEAYEHVEKLLSGNLDKLHLIAEALLEKETLEGKEIDYLLKEGVLPEKSKDKDDDNEPPVAPLTPVTEGETATEVVVPQPAESETEPKAAYTSPEKL